MRKAIVSDARAARLEVRPLVCVPCTFDSDDATVTEIAEELAISVDIKRPEVEGVETKASERLEVKSIEGNMLSWVVGKKTGEVVETDFLGRTMDIFPYLALLEILCVRVSLRLKSDEVMAGGLSI